MTSWQKTYIDKYYRETPGWKDLWEQWHDLLINNIPPNSRVLDVGAGPSNRSSRYLSEIADYLVGVDVDPDVENNEWLDEFHIYDGETFPFADNSFDVVVSNWVNEHLEDPARHCKEIARVLNSDGIYIFRTPNLYHYTAIGARITPHWFHKLVANRLRNFPTDFHEPYPTFHRLNTRGQCYSLLGDNGFDVKVCDVVETFPTYGLSSKPLFYMFMAYERVVNSMSWLEGFRYCIHCVGKLK